MKKAVVLYYSCSNNTKTIAGYVRRVIADKKWEVTIKPLGSNKIQHTLADIDLLVVGVPVHYWDIPDAATERLRLLPVFEDTYGFVFSTFGNCVCNSVPYHLAKVLQSKKVMVLGGAQVVMPHATRLDDDTRIGDVETDFGKAEPSPDNLIKIKTAVSRVVREVEKRCPHTFNVRMLKQLHTRGVTANIMNMIMTTNMRREFMPHVLHDSAGCRYCKKCVLGCDNQAMKPSGGNTIVVDPKKCKRCYKCIETCEGKCLYTDWGRAVSLTRSIHKFARQQTTRAITV